MKGEAWEFCASTDVLVGLRCQEGQQIRGLRCGRGKAPFESLERRPSAADQASLPGCNYLDICWSCFLSVRLAGFHYEVMFEQNALKRRPFVVEPLGNYARRRERITPSAPSLAPLGGSWRRLIKCPESRSSSDKVMTE